MTAGSILVVDRDPAIRGVVRAILRRQGYAIDEAADAGEALACMERQQYDVLLLDLLIKSGGGEAVLSALDSVRPGSPCVVIMSAASPAKLSAIAHPNISARLRKPFDIDELVQAVRECLSAG